MSSRERSADNMHNVILALLIAAAMLFSASAVATPEDDDTVIAQSLAEMVRAAAWKLSGCDALRAIHALRMRFTMASVLSDSS